jgi:C-terminal processing protease CtpA/Prc
LSARRAVTLFAAALALWTGVGAAAVPDSVRVRRLCNVAQVWGEIRYKHPWLAYQDIDWDSALVAALPGIEAAPDSVAYARAVQGMLAALGDPATHVESPRSSPMLSPNPPPFTRWNGRALVVSLAATTRYDFQIEPALRSLPSEIAKARGVVFDLRMRDYRVSFSYDLEQRVRRLVPLVFSGELPVPGSRSALYSGYPAQSGISPSYSLGFQARAGEVVRGTMATPPEGIVFLIDEWSPAPLELLALRQRGIALLATEGNVDESAFVEQKWLDAGEGVWILTRTEELDLPFGADARFPTGSGRVDVALKKCCDLALAGPPRHKPAAAPALPGALWRPDRAYADTPYPDRAHRQLAAIRQWNVIRLFYPYLDLLDGAWDGSLARFLPRFENARNAREYTEAVLAMEALVKDGHTVVSGDATKEIFGGGVPPPFEPLEVEGKPVVLSVGTEASAAGLTPGDVIETVDGEPIAERIARIDPFVTASTPNALALRRVVTALLGPDSSTVTLRVNGGSGSKDVTLRRTVAALAAMHVEPEPYRILPGNVGYVLLPRLQPDEVAPMFDALQNTRAIVFDLRGYPNGTIWTIAPRLNTRHARVGAIFERPLVSSGGPARYKFEQEIAPYDGPLYRGRTVTLIDERAQSHAEHTALFLEAANGTTFVGSPTSGANGDVTRFTLPGGITVMFTGHDVRHADGRRLQRVGIQPDVVVRPTIAGLRAGRDEVLERALALIGPDPTSAPR